MHHQPTSQTISSRQPGFTLLELMITTMLGALLLLGATAMFGLFMTNNSKTNIRRQINSEGQQVMSVIEYNLRNARSITTCGPTSVVFKQFDDQTVTIQRNTTSPAFMQRQVGAGTFSNLHSQFAVASGGANFSCPAGNQTVTIDFTLAGGGASQTFRSTVEVRNVTLR